MAFGINKDSKTIKPASRLTGSMIVCGDKSISHRSIILTSLAKGRSVIKNFLYSEDCINTMKVFKKLGVSIKEDADGSIVVEGSGLEGLKKPGKKLYFGNSGTGMRLTAGVLAAQKFPTVLVGDDSLMKRPMKRISVPLNKMGADVRTGAGGCPPLEIMPAQVKGITYESPIASAQVKSCLLLAGLFSGSTTEVSEPYKSRDHTERMMQYFNIPLEVNETTVSVTGGSEWAGKEILVPGDFSAAAFFITACLLMPNSHLKIKGLNLNPTRTGFIKILRRMGADIGIKNERNVCNEPVGDVYISSADLQAVEITGEDIPSVIDEIPLLALLATRAEGRTIINEAGELRKKETDRLHAVSTQLNNMGQSITEHEDSLVIEGREAPLKGTGVESFGDHRMAMMLTVAGLLAQGKTKINGVKCIETSFPGFFDKLEDVIER
ncbi:3-phosphoshikimate 1-carboxyvinyltransferase [Elusimicrobiota bacterium]